MKTPALLLGATLVFWGWRTGHLVEGALMAVLLEASRVTKARLDFKDEDFRRIWTFCALLLLATALYAFSASGGPGDVLGFLQNPGFASQRAVGNTSARTVSALIRWLPMIFFLFVAAQAYSSRQGIAPETISVILRLRWQRARKLGLPLPSASSVDVSYPFFILCLVSSCFSTSEDNGFYWGLCVLLAWVLWPQRSRRFKFALWAGSLVLVMLLGYGGQRGVGRAYRLFDAYNMRWFLRIGGRGTDPAQSKTALGDIGRLSGSGKIVIRLQPKEGSRAPGLLREASYQIWKGQVWLSEVRRDRFENVYEQTNHTTWVLVPGKTNAAAVTIGCHLPGGVALLPLPSGTGQLDNLSAHLLQKSELGAVLAEGPGLVVFDALYDPARPMIDSPANEDQDLRVPAREMAALDQVISELKLKELDRKNALKTLNAFFEDKFRYRTWQEPDKLNTNETALGRFLLRTRSGHCEYFATATVLLLRQIKIPARYAVGFGVHETSGKGYVVRQRDAHAWCLVWNPTSETWQDFDTTPASWVATESKRASPMQALSDLWSGLMFEISKFRWGQSRVRQYVLWGLGPLLILLFYRIVAQVRRQRRALSPEDLVGQAAPWPGLDSEFYQVEQRIAARGAGRVTGESLSDWLRRASQDPRISDLRELLRHLLQLHYRYRFDPQGLTQAEREELRQQASACLARLH